MSTFSTPTPTEILHSLTLLRSADPAARLRGIRTLRQVRDDPRVQQVFEYLYQQDPAPAVRQAAWQALRESAPAIPAPKPHAGHAVPSARGPEALASDAMNPSASPQKKMAKSRSNRRRSAPPSDEGPFLLDPANRKLIAEERERIATQKKRGRSAFLLAAVVFLIMGVLWALALPQIRDWYRLDRNGAQAEGTITALERRGGEYVVHYTFNVRQGETESTYEGQQQVTEADWRQAAEGDPVRVTFWLDDPTLSRIDADDPSLAMRDRLILGASALAVLALMFLSLGMVQRQAWLRRRRRILPGQIVACTGSVDADGDYKVKIRYRFRTPQGQLITAQTSQIRNDLRRKALPRPGTAVAVYYRNAHAYRLL